MAVWLKIPPPVQLIDPRTGMPVAEPVFEDVGGQRVARTYEDGPHKGEPIIEVMKPFSLLIFMERYALNSRFVPSGLKGARFVRRVRNALKAGEESGWAQVDEADVEEVRRILEKVEKFEDTVGDDPRRGRTFDAGILAQLVDHLECWDKGNILKEKPTDG